MSDITSILRKELDLIGKDLIKSIKNLILLHRYKKHLKKRIDKNNFGRRPEY